MSYGPPPMCAEHKIKMVPDGVMDDVLRVVEAYFEAQLREMGLSKTQIESASLEELGRSLEAADKAIENVDGFDTVPISFGVQGGKLQAVLSRPDEANLWLSVAPLVLARRRMIVDRIDKLADVQAKRALEAIASSGAGAVDEETRHAAEEALAGKEVADAVDAEKHGDPFAAYWEQVRIAELELKVARGRTEIRQSWFSRETVAAIVGGVLLIALAVTLIVAMFLGIEPAEVVTNAFLLILGYFFGQAASATREES
jgi:hypothetical protein